MELEGQIDEIIYQNESNSYTIATFVTEESDICNGRRCLYCSSDIFRLLIVEII